LRESLETVRVGPISWLSSAGDVNSTSESGHLFGVTRFGERVPVFVCFMWLPLEQHWSPSGTAFAAVHTSTRLNYNKTKRV